MSKKESYEIPNTTLTIKVNQYVEPVVLPTECAPAGEMCFGKTEKWFFVFGN